MKKIKNNIYVLYTLLLSLLIILVFFYINNITPFGSKDFTVIDFYHQYFPMTSELINRILNSKTLLFSFNGSLPFIRNLYNYLSSPFNILLLPFKDNLSTGFSLLIAIKAILASTTICYYLTKNIKNSIQGQILLLKEIPALLRLQNTLSMAGLRFSISQIRCIRVAE